MKYTAQLVKCRPITFACNKFNDILTKIAFRNLRFMVNNFKYIRTVGLIMNSGLL